MHEHGALGLGGPQALTVTPPEDSSASTLYGDDSSSP